MRLFATLTPTRRATRSPDEADSTSSDPLTQEERVHIRLLSEVTGAWFVTALLLGVHPVTLDRVLRGSRVHGETLRRVRRRLKTAMPAIIHEHEGVQ